MLRTFEIRFFLFLVTFTCTYSEDVRNQPSASDNWTNISTNSVFCASYEIQGRNNDSLEGSVYCNYPDLYSTKTGKCEKFTEVDCGNRTEPFTPCEYPQLNCTRPRGKDVDLCTCENYPDLNYDMCLNLKDGQHVWPARHWSPFYVKCLSRRTLPSSCSGHSVIYNFFQDECQFVYEVVNAAYSLSLSFSIPESLYHLISYRPTPTRLIDESTHDIVMTNFGPTPSPHVEIRSTSYLAETDTFIRSNTEYTLTASNKRFYTKLAPSKTLFPQSDKQLASTRKTLHGSSVYDFELSTELLTISISSDHKQTDNQQELVSFISASPNYMSYGSSEGMTKYIDTEVLLVTSNEHRTMKTYSSQTFGMTSSFAKQYLTPSSDGSIETKRGHTPNASTPSSFFDGFINTQETIIYSKTSYQLETLPAFLQSLPSLQISTAHVESTRSSFSNSRLTYPEFPSSSGGSKLSFATDHVTSNKESETSSEMSHSDSLYVEDSRSIPSAISSLGTSFSSTAVAESLSSSSLVHTIPPLVFQSSKAFESALLPSYNAVKSSSFPFEYSTSALETLKKDEIYTKSLFLSSSILPSLLSSETAYKIANGTSNSFTHSSLLQSEYSSSAEYSSLPLNLNSSVLSVNYSPAVIEASSTLSILGQIVISTYPAALLSTSTTTELSSSSLQTAPFTSFSSHSSSLFSSLLLKSIPATTAVSLETEASSPATFSSLTPLPSSSPSSSSPPTPSSQPLPSPPPSSSAPPPSPLSPSSSLSSSLLSYSKSSSIYLETKLPSFLLLSSSSPSSPSNITNKSLVSTSMYRTSISIITPFTSHSTLTQQSSSNSFSTPNQISSMLHLTQLNLNTGSSLLYKSSSTTSEKSRPTSSVESRSKLQSVNGVETSTSLQTDMSIELTSSEVLPSKVEFASSPSSTLTDGSGVHELPKPSGSVFLLESSSMLNSDSYGILKQSETIITGSSRPLLPSETFMNDRSGILKHSKTLSDSFSTLQQSSIYIDDSSSLFKPSNTVKSFISDILKPHVTFMSDSPEVLKPSIPFKSDSLYELKPSETSLSDSSSLLKPLNTFISDSYITSKPSETFMSKTSILEPSKNLQFESSHFTTTVGLSSELSTTVPHQTPPIKVINKSGGNSAEIQKNNETSIAIGVGVGGGIVLICIIVLIVIITLRKRKRRGRRDFFQVRLPPELFMTRRL